MMSAIKLPVVFRFAMLASFCLLAWCRGAYADEDVLAAPFELKIDGSIMQTRMNPNHEGPPPWLNGNLAIFGNWHVLNIHAENLSALRKELQLKSLTVRPIDSSHVLVIDERVDREWLTHKPIFASLRQQLDLVRRYPSHFKILSEAEALVGSTWELVDCQGLGKRYNPDVPIKLLESLLPDPWIEFRETTILCKNEIGEIIAERDWLIDKTNNSVSLTIYLTDDAADDALRDYEAVSFKLAVSDGELKLTSTHWHHSDERPQPLDGNNGQTRLQYRRISRLP